MFAIYKGTTIPSRQKPVLAPLLWFRLGGSSHKEYYDALVSGTKLSHYTDAIGAQCDRLPRSFPSQPGVVSAASARHLFLLSSFPALYWVRQLRPLLAWCIALMCNFLGLPVALFLPGEPEPAVIFFHAVTAGQTEPPFSKKPQVIQQFSAVTAAFLECGAE